MVEAKGGHICQKGKEILLKEDSDLAEAVVEGKSFDAKLFHSLQLLLVEILKFVPDNKNEEF